MKYLPLPGLLLLLSGVAVAHPRHAQLTEIEWNPDSQCFEVAMRLDEIAVEDELSVRQQSVVRFSRLSHPEQRLVPWLKDCFAITIEGQSATGDIRWVGMEHERDGLWLYFEYAPQALTQAPALQPKLRVRQPEQIHVRHRCLSNVRPDMVHAVRLRLHHRIWDTHCGPGLSSSKWTSLSSVTRADRPARQTQILREQTN